MLELANPLGLSLLLIAPALAYAYRRRRSERTKVVSSLLILKTLSRKAVPKKRIKLPFRFYIELLALLALASASTLPSLKTKQIAVLFDNSMSMSALESVGKSRLDIAIEKFNKQKSTKNSYTIFASSPELKSSDLSINASSGTDSINSAISQLAGEYEKVWIFSDKKATNKVEKFEVYEVGSVVDNLYIQSASLEKDGQIKVRIYNASDKKSSCELIVNGLDFSGKSTKELHRKSININPNISREIELVSPTKELAYKIEINTDQEDAIKADNIAWLAASDKTNTKILVVSEQKSGLENIPGFNVTQIGYDDYLLLEDFKKYSLVIFHRVAPEIAPPLPSLFVLPPADNKFFEIKTSKKIKISSWNKNHTISSYLKADLISATEGLEFKTPLWADAIINGENGSIITAGQYDSRLVAASGIELLPYEGKKTPALSILTVNLIKWLISKNKIGAENLVGDNFLVEKDSVVIKPNQEVLKNISEEIALDQAGIYLLSKQGSLAVNSFFDKESNTQLTQELLLPKNYSKFKKQLSTWWKYLIIAAISFLTLEMFLKRER